MDFRDIVSGLFWLAISISVCLVSIPLGIGTLRFPGPGFFPLCSAVAMGIFSIVLMISSAPKRKVEERISSLGKGTDWHNVILVLTSLFIYAILLPRLGYLIVTFGLLTFLFSLLSRQRLWIRGVTSLIIVVASYLVFNVWLKVQLPKDIFGF